MAGAVVTLLSGCVRFAGFFACTEAACRVCLKVMAVSLMGVILWAALTGCASTPSRPPDLHGTEIGFASYYADRFQGRRTASGERYDRRAYTAAHRRLGFGTRVEVIRLDNGKSVTVRINDRGPFVKGRVIDLSYAAAKELGMLQTGVVEVRIVPVD
jgi:rare lipoprotein A